MKPKNLYTAIIVLSVLFVVPAVSQAHTYDFVLSWGSEGPGDGQFQYPRGIAVDSSGNVYVADSWNDRIQKFDSCGTFLVKWGGYGTGDGQFNLPRGIAADSSGNVYVADTKNYRIQKFSSIDGINYTIAAKWGSYGPGDGQFNLPHGIAADSSGNVYVADSSNDRIQKFNSSGTLLAKWGSQGSGDGEFRWPYGIAADSSGNVYNVYVADQLNHRIQKFDSNGAFLLEWGSLGSGDGQFRYPHGIAVDLSGDVYVTDFDDDRIQKFDSDGNFITKWGSYGSGEGEFNNPYGIAVDYSGIVYVLDTFNNRIQKFREGTNEAPVADAGPDQTVLVNESAIFDGSLSYDPDGTIDSYNWDFGDATQGSGLIDFHTYNTAGTYTITLTVTDDDGATGTDTAEVTVLSPAQAIVGLIGIVEDMNLQQGIANSLDVKLEAVQDALVAANAGVRQDAVNKLEAFINAVEAQRGKVLTDEQADQLVNYANRIIATLSVP